MKLSPYVKMGTVCLALLMVTFAPAFGSAQTEENQEFVAVDCSQLAGGQGMTILDIYAQVNRSGLTVRPAEDGGVHAMYEVTVSLLKDGEVLAENSWKRDDWSVNSESRDNTVSIPELQRLGVVPGEYSYRVRIEDLLGDAVQVVEGEVTARQMARDHLEVSDVLLASRFEARPEDPAEFDHSGMLVIPDAHRVYGEDRVHTPYYVEVYGLNTEGMNKFAVQRRVLDGEGRLVREFDKKVYPAFSSDARDYGTLPLGQLPPGEYSFEVAVTDSATGRTVTRTQQFAVRGKPENPNPIDPTFAERNMSEEEVILEFDAIQYLLAQREKNRCEEITEVDDMRRYLTAFWRSVDPDRETEVNEFRKDYLARMNKANERFGSTFVPGWKRDRGRVLMMFGEPDYIHDQPTDLDNPHPYQIWLYDSIEGGVQFVFVDRNDLGLYDQVHSTKRGEPRNFDWKTQGYQGPRAKPLSCNGTLDNRQQPAIGGP